MEMATRHNEGKLKWSLVSFEALEPMVKGLEFGAKKYGIDNWKKGLPITEVCESMLRHIFAYLGGEDIDPESGLPHIAHIQDNAMFLGYMDLKMPQFDDRPTKQDWIINPVKLEALLQELQPKDADETNITQMGGAYNPPKDKRPFAPLFENHKPPKPIIE